MKSGSLMFLHVDVIAELLVHRDDELRKIWLKGEEIAGEPTASTAEVVVSSARASQECTCFTSKASRTATSLHQITTTLLIAALKGMDICEQRYGTLSSSNESGIIFTPSRPDHRGAFCTSSLCTPCRGV